MPTVLAPMTLVKPGFGYCSIHVKRQCALPLRLRHRQTAAASSSGQLRDKPTVPNNDPIDNPDFDQVVLDDQYYAEMGMTREEAEDEAGYRASDIDPMGQDLALDELFKTRKGLPQHMMQDLEKAEQKGWGPDVLLLAGFRAEEIAMARIVLDAAGASGVKVVPCTQQILYMTVEQALQMPEPDWENPRDPRFFGGGWGAQRTIVFSGLSLKAQATVIELLEDNGLPAISATMVTQETAQDVVGELMAAAVKEQRERRNDGPEPWDEMAMESDELEPVEKVLAEQTKERLKEMADGLEGEDFDDLFDDDNDDEMTLSIEDVKAAREWRKKQLEERQQQQSGDNDTNGSGSPAPATNAEEPTARTDRDVTAHSKTAEEEVVEAEFSDRAVDSSNSSQPSSNGNGSGVQSSSGGAERAEEQAVQDLTGLFASRAELASTSPQRQGSSMSMAISQLHQRQDSATNGASHESSQQGQSSSSSQPSLEREKIEALSTQGVAGSSQELYSRSVPGVDAAAEQVGSSAAATGGGEGKWQRVTGGSEAEDEDSSEDMDEDEDGAEDEDEAEDGECWEEDAEINAALQAEENLLDNIATGKPMTFQDLMKSFGDMGQGARKQVGLGDDAQHPGEDTSSADGRSWGLSDDTAELDLQGPAPAVQPQPRCGSGSNGLQGVEVGGTDSNSTHGVNSLGLEPSSNGVQGGRGGAAAQARAPGGPEQDSGTDWQTRAAGFETLRKPYGPVPPSRNGSYQDSKQGTAATGEEQANGSPAFSMSSLTEVANTNGSTATPKNNQSTTQANGAGPQKQPKMDVVDTGFRPREQDRPRDPSTPSTLGLDEELFSPLDAFREACARAFDAGLPYDVLLAALDEAERGGSPVLRYRPWHADGNHVDYEEDDPDQSQEGQPGTVVMTRTQLREAAERNGLSFNRLLADAKAKGIIIPEDS